jgi:hypothetical protein
MNRILIILLLALAAFVRAQEPAPRFFAVLQTTYDGNHPDLYAQEQDRVRILIRQAQLEISSQLGLLEYRENFRRPLTVRFDDAPVRGLEHALAYVTPRLSDGGFSQELVVNLDVMANSRLDFDRIFYHEMTHAVLNDAVVSLYDRPLPSWVQEGLAVYISGEGPERVHALSQQYKKSQVKTAVRDLEYPVLDYARNYLAFKYMVDKQSINTLQTFVRDLTQGKQVQEAAEDSTGLSWDAFRQNVKDYTLEIYQSQARPDLGIDLRP